MPEQYRNGAANNAGKPAPRAAKVVGFPPPVSSSWLFYRVISHTGYAEGRSQPDMSRLEWAEDAAGSGLLDALGEWRQSVEKPRQHNGAFLSR